MAYQALNVAGAGRYPHANDRRAQAFGHAVTTSQSSTRETAAESLPRRLFL
jgi:hypothetical protein